MNYFRLFYGSFVFFASYRFGLCEEILHDLNVESIRVYGINKDYGSTLISKYKYMDRFVIRSDALDKLIDGTFTSYNVEILESFDRKMKISIMRKRKFVQYYFDIVFSTRDDLQKFFHDLRSPPKNISEKIQIKKIFEYPEDDQPISVQKLTLVSQHDYFYARELDPQWFEDPKTFNFVHVRHIRAHEADLILQSGTFSISARLGDNICVLCTFNIDHYRVFVVLFPDMTNADAFRGAVERDLDGDMQCSHDWLTPELLEKINRRTTSSI